VRRPPGLRIDGGGLVKGLLADRLAEALTGHASFGIDCAGDLRIGGAAGLSRTVHVESPFDGERLHSFELQDAGIATSGIGRRSWIDAAGRPAQHLLDPATRRPAFTGIVQVTAIAPTAFAAELRAKTALLSGPDTAPAWLPDGGVIVADDGSHTIV
jgi:thiamine biosynthesis lipoprotein